MIKRKIMVADDSRDIVEAVQFNLELAGFEVVTAFDGREAISTACREMPDLLVLDVMMPGENGYRVSRFIKDNIQKGVLERDIKILLFTARVLNDDAREATMMQFSLADDMMYKPFNMDHLLEKVKSLLAL